MTRKTERRWRTLTLALALAPVLARCRIPALPESGAEDGGAPAAPSSSAAAHGGASGGVETTGLPISPSGGTNASATSGGTSSTAPGGERGSDSGSGGAASIAPTGGTMSIPQGGLSGESAAGAGGSDTGPHEGGAAGNLPPDPSSGGTADLPAPIPPPLCRSARFQSRGPEPDDPNILPTTANQHVMRGLSEDFTLDAVLGVAANGTVLHVRAREEMALLLSVPIEGEGTSYETTDIGAQIEPGVARTDRGAISWDASELILLSPELKAFKLAHLSTEDVDSIDVGPFAELNASIPAGCTVYKIVPSSDGSTLLYALVDCTAPTNDGSYFAERKNAGEWFGKGRKLSAQLQGYTYVTGMSADTRTLFLMKDFRTHIYVRDDPSQPWSDFTGHFATVEGINYHPDAVPNADCSRLLTTCTPGGAWQAQICALERLPD